jgi:hypothetical protein
MVQKMTPTAASRKGEAGAGEKPAKRSSRSSIATASGPKEVTPRRQGAKKTAEIPKRLLTTLQLCGFA